MVIDGWVLIDGKEYYQQTVKLYDGRNSIFPKQLAHSDSGGYRYRYDNTYGYWVPTKKQCEFMMRYFRMIK